MTNNSALLGNIFKMVTQNLVQNKQTLNQADEQNHDHGTNMVQTFQTITNALTQHKDSPPSDALRYAAEQVSKESKSGSGQLYAQGLQQAAQQMQGQQLTQQSAMQILQTLISGGQAQPAQPAAGGDMLSQLLGGLAGAQAPQPAAQPAGENMLGNLLGGLMGTQQPQQPQQASGGGDLLGSLLGGLTGAQQQPQQPQGGLSDGLDLGDLVNAGMAYMQAKQGGSNDTGALMQAFMAGSGMGNTNHRQQSTQLVANTFLQALGTLMAKK
jgi:hypothetical protein